VDQAILIIFFQLQFVLSKILGADERENTLIDQNLLRLILLSAYLDKLSESDDLNSNQQIVKHHRE